MSNSLVSVNAGRPANVSDVLTLGKLLAESKFFPDASAAAQAVVKVLAGQEMGFGPVSAMTGINIIRGKVSVSANLMAAAIRRSGRYDYTVRHLDDQRCEIEFFMDKQSIGVSSFSLGDAKKAGLSGDNWRKYPRNMLFARAMSNGAKWFCPDVFNGPVYTPDELGAVVDGESGNVITVLPEQQEMVPAQQLPNSEPYVEIEQLVRRKGADIARLLAHYEAASLHDLTSEQSAEVVETLSKRPDVQQGPHGAESASTDKN
ncbi:MAG: hypothetical protein FJ271_09595 [Planctomycetes bacterium]|nr:hypothetical protein [Planctomycetota bacterium]